MSYEWVISQRGRSMILIGGYTYSQLKNCPNTWVCSKKNIKCKAKVKLDEDAKVIALYDVHCHPKRRYVWNIIICYQFVVHFTTQKINCNLFIFPWSCFCRIRYWMHKTGHYFTPIYSNTQEINWIDFHVADLGCVQFLPARGQKNLIMYENYLFCFPGVRRTYLRCSRYSQVRCKVTLNITKEGKVIKKNMEHNHDPPEIYRTKEGEYFKI